jgi:predicted XRE-type DNA-binding protein
MKKTKTFVARNAGELARALGLTPADGAQIELRSELNSKIAEVVAQKGLTHAEVAKLARTSRTRVTAILNRNTKDVSTDLLLRVLYALGYTAKVKFRKAA